MKDQYELILKSNTIYKHGKLLKNGKVIFNICCHFLEISPNWLLIFDSIGSSEMLSQGELLMKIYIGDSEFCYKRIDADNVSILFKNT